MHVDLITEVERLRGENARLQALDSSLFDSSAQEREQLRSDNQKLEAEILRLREQAETLNGEHSALKSIALLQAEQLQFKDEQRKLSESAHTVDYEQLVERVQELEAENTRLTVIVEHAEISLSEQQTTAPTLDLEQLHSVRSSIVKNWRVALGPEKRERIKLALDKFIEALASTPASTPESE